MIEENESCHVMSCHVMSCRHVMSCHVANLVHPAVLSDICLGLP
jgi:hypothetical protein